MRDANLDLQRTDRSMFNYLGEEDLNNVVTKSQINYLETLIRTYDWDRSDYVLEFGSQDGKIACLVAKMLKFLNKEALILSILVSQESKLHSMEPITKYYNNIFKNDVSDICTPLLSTDIRKLSNFFNKIKLLIIDANYINLMDFETIGKYCSLVHHDGSIFIIDYSVLSDDDQANLDCLLNIKAGYKEIHKSSFKVLKVIINKNCLHEINNIDGDLASLINKVHILENQLENKNQEIQILKATLRQRESSLSWKISQLYGSYFKSDSIITCTLSYILNDIISLISKKFLKKYVFSSNEESEMEFGPKVTVVLPVYNQSNLIEQSIKSVLSQTYKNLELIIINDGSTDNIWPILDRYADQPRIIVLTQENQKLPKALSNGFRIASGEFFTWTSADNIMLPRQLEEQVTYLLKNPHSDMVFCDYEVINDEGKPLLNSDFRIHNQIPRGSSFIHLPRSTKELNIIKDNFIGPCFMYRGIVGRILGDYDPNTFGCEDYDYWMRMNRLFTIEHLGKDDILYRYRVHKNTISAKAEKLGVYERVGKLMEYDVSRSEFYKKRFDIFSVEANSYAFLIKSTTTGINDVINVQPDEKINIKEGKNILLNTKIDCENYFYKFLNKNIYKIILIDKNIDEFDLDKDVFVLSDSILAIGKENFELLHHRYREKLFYLAKFDKSSAKLIINLANSNYEKIDILKEFKVSPKIYINRKLNVLIETENLDRGGVEQVIFNIATNLDKNRFNTFIVCIKNEGKIAEKCRSAGIPVFLINNDKSRYIELVTKLNIDLINAHHSIFGLDISNRYSLPFIYVIHNCYVWLSNEDISRLKAADLGIKKYIAVSKNVAKYYRKYINVSPRKMEIISNGINIETGVLSDNEKKEIRRKLGIKENDYVFLNVGAYRPSKNHNIIISAVKELINTYTNIRVFCVGEVGDALYYDNLMNRLIINKLERYITFTGYVSNETLNNFYNIADAFLLPSLFEGWSVSTMEAMLIGLPMILTDVGCSREIINNKDIGIIIENAFGNILNLNLSNINDYYGEFRPSNTDLLTNAMKDFIKNKYKWKKLGHNGREKVKNLYNLNNMIRSYEDLFINTFKNII
jgi:glycosyltransferase involved in cell wall biosynthesis